MELNTAKEIARLATSNNMVKAIMMFRVDVPVGLTTAKSYLEEFGRAGEDDLFRKLCKDFISNKKDLLIQAVAEQRRLATYIEQLVCEISAEEEEESQIEEVPQGLVIKATANFEVTSHEESNEHV